MQNRSDKPTPVSSWPDVSSINRKARLMEGYASEAKINVAKAAGIAVEIGADLAAVRADLRGGGWRLWVEANLEMSQKRVNACVKVYEMQLELNLGTQNGVTEVARLLDIFRKDREPLLGDAKIQKPADYLTPLNRWMRYRRKANFGDLVGAIDQEMREQMKRDLKPMYDDLCRLFGAEFGGRAR